MDLLDRQTACLPVFSERASGLYRLAERLLADAVLPLLLEPVEEPVEELADAPTVQQWAGMHQGRDPPADWPKAA